MNLPWELPFPATSEAARSYADRYAMCSIPRVCVRKEERLARACSAGMQACCGRGAPERGAQAAVGSPTSVESTAPRCCVHEDSSAS